MKPEGFRLTLRGQFGERFDVLGSTNFVEWTTLETLTNSFGRVEFTAPDGTNGVVGTNGTCRFYRAVELP